MINFEFYKDLLAVTLSTIVFSGVQVYFAKHRPWYMGLFLPVIYWIFAAPYIRNCIITGENQLRTDYYSAATFFFPGIWLFLLYYIVFFYWKWRAKYGDNH